MPGDLEILHILNLEDAPLDEELISAALTDGGIGHEIRRVQTREDFVAALEDEDLDIILGDFSLPSFDGLSALRIAREMRPEVPFVFVSGTIGEEAAIESLRSGATDYVLKQRVERLVPAVLRAVREAGERAERRRAEEKYRNIFENAVDGIFQSNLEGRFITVNPAMARIFGYESPQEMIEDVTDVVRQLYVDPNDRKELVRLIREHGAVSRFEVRGRRKDGSIIWISADARAIYEEGNLVGFEGTMEDITERRRTEEALRQSEELYRTVVEQAEENIFLVDVETKRIVEANPAVLRSLGYSAEELRKMTLYDLIAHDRGSVDANVKSVLEEKRFFVGERRYRRKDGSLIDVEVMVSVVSLDERETMCIIAHDITERKRAEESLRQSEERYRAVVEQTVEGLFLFDAETRRILETNPTFQELLGYTAEELQGMSLYDLIADGAEGVDWDLQHTVEGRHILVGERRCRRKDGTEVDVEVSGSVISYGGRQIISALARDVTERKRAQEALIRSEERFRSLVRYASDIILILDADGTILYASAAIENVLGFSPQQRMGTDVFEHLHPEDVDTVRRRFAECLERPRERLFMEYRVRDREGYWHDFETITTNLLEDTIIRGVVMNTRDVTERKRAEQALDEVREAERSRIARDLHDDVLQDLADALRETEISQMMLDEQNTEASRARLGRAIEAIRRAGGGLRGAVYNLHLGEPLDQPFPRMLESLVELNRRMAPGCDIRLAIDERFPGKSFGEKGVELLRLFQEALVNVRRHSAARHVWVSLKTEGSDLLGEVVDDGRGFEPEVAAGVGLTGIRQRTAALGGELEIWSRPGEGSQVRFKISLSQLPGSPGRNGGEGTGV